MRRSQSALRASAAILAACLSFNLAIADEPPVDPELVNVQVGCNDKFKLGCWTPVELTFRGPADRLTGIVELTTADGDGTPVRYRSQPFQLTPGRETTVTVYAQFGRVNVDAEVTLAGDSGIRFQRTLSTIDDGDKINLPLPLATEDRLIVCVGRMPTLTQIARELNSAQVGTVSVAEVADPLQLPTSSLGYDGIDAVVIAPAAAESFAALTPDSAQVVALRQWIELGGRVWATASDEAAPIFTTGGAFESLHAVGPGPGTTLPRTTALEKLAGAETVQSITAAELQRTPILAPPLNVDDAVVAVAEGDLPLVTRRVVGFGLLVTTAFHPEHALLQKWTGRTGVVRNLLVLLDVVTKQEADAAARGTAPTGSTRKSPSNFGYQDLAGQLRSSLDQYPGVQVVSFFSLSMLVIGYLVLVGPLDYWFVRRVLKRPEMTWVTFPAMVLVTSLAAYYLAVEMKGKELRISAADVVDCDAASGTVRATSWAGVFSPVGRTYDVRWRPELPLVATRDDSATTSWFGLPGGGLGGMHVRGGTGGWFTQSYSADTGDAGLSEVPIQVWSSKMFTGRRVGRSRNSLHAPLVVEADNRLSGALRNPFPCEIDDALLCFGTEALIVGRLAVGAELDVTRLEGRALQAVLHRRQVVLSDNKSPLHVGQEHDPGSRDAAEILQKIMFFTVSGGSEHVNLDNRYYPLLDFSTLITLRRAVLVGRVDATQVGDLQLNDSGVDAARGTESRAAFVRLVIPVTPADSTR